MIDINGIHINLATGELYHGDEVTLLEPKVIEVLRVLYHAKGELVSQQTLLDTVWPNTFVAPNALQRCITQLRKHLQDTDKSVIETFPKRGYRLKITPVTINPRRKRPAYLFASTALIIFGGLIFTYIVWPTSSSLRPTVLSLTPLTYEHQPEQQGTANNQYLVYVKHDETHATLISQDRQTKTITELHQAHNFFGHASFAKHNNRVLISEQVIINDEKCSQIVEVPLQRNAAVKVVSPCLSSTIKQVHWLNEHDALYLSDNALYLLDLSQQKTQKLAPLSTDLMSISQISVDQNRWVIAGQNKELHHFLWFYDVDAAYTPTLQAQTAVNYDVNLASMPIALNANTWLQSHSNTLYFYCNNALCHQQTLYTQANITLTGSLSPSTLLATSELKDVDITAKHWQNNTWQTQPFTNSDFPDQDAQFQPFGHAIAFLSSRSGQQQIWLHDLQGDQQLTFAAPVSNFVWQSNGKALWFVSGAHVYQLSLTGQITPYFQNTSVSQLMQHVQSDGAPWLLASSELDNTLIALDLTTGQVKQLTEQPIAWAQATGPEVIYLASFDEPFIKRLQQLSLTPIKSLATTQLQWRFYLRDNQLYIPDKQRSIWQYDLTTERITQLGQYNQATHLATDFNVHPIRLLSNTDVASRTHLVAIELSSPVL
ncbi:hypothetical protein PULV_a0359 [Pseudoalteromonas ulvae UL12]|uniref:OmpR/PhoB-type domain-containing protein n=1 Tax=Pseudoalteromonas ulvae TaxID=107327 RepID=A0A244CUJ9_PSEDV|nr:winged helix-turn-helix domain-containing protein [Pseudoalteromonas ulvae]MBE0362790.1 hypothetical protein [Pseudoalteromonas ulvae UL12]OUL59287.1 hypothetical protein B1199_03185 [Pseudoalteromonas ulvae]